MKSIVFALLLSLFLGGSLFAQVSRTFAYQAIARDQQGNLKKTPISIEISILLDSPSGTSLYVERHEKVQPNPFGLLTLSIGTGKVINGSFEDLIWGQEKYFLKVIADFQGGTNFSDLISTTEVLAVPYALYAEKAGSATLIAGPGIQYKDGVVSNTGDIDPKDDIVASSRAGGDLNGTFSTLQINTEAVGTAEIANATIAAIDLSSMGATKDQVLKFNGTSWTPSVDLIGNVITYVKGRGIDIQDAVISNTGDIDPDDDLLTTSQAGGDLTGTFDNLQIKSNAVGSTEIANGAIVGVDLNAMGATKDQVLKFNGSVWMPSSDQIGNPITYTKGTGIDIQGAVISNTGDTNPSDDLLITSQAGGDLSGTFSNLQIKANAVESTTIADGSIAALDLSAMGAAKDQVLKFNGSIWIPSTDLTGTQIAYTKGAGIDIQGTVISNTGDINASDDLLTTSQAGGDLSGTFSNLTIKTSSVTGLEIADGSVAALDLSSMGAVKDQVLKFNGTTWVPSLDLVGSSSTYIKGAGIDIQGNVISNTGDLNPSDDLLTTTQVGGDLIGTFDNLQIKSNAVGSTEIANGSIVGVDLNGMGAAEGQVLQYIRNEWKPATLTTGSASDWKKESTGLFYDLGNVALKNTGGKDLIRMGEVVLPNGQFSKSSVLIGNNANGKANWSLEYIYGYESYGALALYGPNGYAGFPPFNAFVNPTNGAGTIVLNSQTGINSVYIGAVSTNGESGYIGLRSKNKENVTLVPNIANCGTISTFASNGRDVLVDLNSMSYNDTYGAISVKAAGVDQAGIYIDEQGRGIVWGDAKNFRTDFPNEPDKEIWYASVEGPEVGAYDRGVGKLKSGECFIPFPDHFSALIDPNTITVQLTPQSADTYGLAVIEKTSKGFKVKELKKGKGNFSFDWEVKAKRKGYEDFQVVRDKDSVKASLQKKHESPTLFPNKK